MPRTRPTADLFDVVRRLRYATDTVAVGFSCGKDSAATADLCINWFDKVVLFYMYSVADLSFHRAYLNYFAKRAGSKLLTGKILQIPHWSLSRKLKFCHLREHNPRMWDLPVLRLKDIECEVARQTGVTFFAYGQKKTDSLERRAMLSKANGIMLEANRGFPLAEWNNRTVTQYLRSRGIPLSPEYQHFGTSYGGQLEGHYLSILHEHYPEDYAKVLARFPFADAERLRHEMLKSQGERSGAKKQA